MKTERNRINENQKVTLTIGQLKKLISEANEKPFRAADLAKYGFTHDKADDFTDDGSRFYVYRLAGTGMEVSYLRTGTTIYLSASAASGSDVQRAEQELDYSEYHNLPGYSDLDMFNGVAEKEITPEGLNKLIDSMKKYEAAVLDAAGKIEGASQDAVDSLNSIILKQTEDVYNSCKNELIAAMDAISANSYKKNFDFYIKRVFDSLSSIKSQERYMVKVGSRNAYDRRRVANPDKTTAEINEYIEMYARDFHKYLDKVKSL